MNCDQDESNIISTTRFWTEKILEDYDNCNRERWKKTEKSLTWLSGTANKD